MGKLLTIIVLSYERPKLLDTLLFNLVEYIKVLKISSLVDIRIRINPSPGYEYKNIFKKYSSCDFIEINENETNIGSEKSFCREINYIKTPYLWQLGDDDNIDIEFLRTFIEASKSNYDYILFNYTYYKIINNKKIDIGTCFDKNERTQVIDNPLDLIKKYSIHFGFASMNVIKTDVYKRTFFKIDKLALQYNLPSSNLKPLLIILNTMISKYKGFLISESYLQAFHPGDISFDRPGKPLTNLTFEFKTFFIYLNYLIKQKSKFLVKKYIKIGYFKRFLWKSIVTTSREDFKSFQKEIRQDLRYPNISIFVIKVYRFIFRNFILTIKRFGLLTRIRIHGHYNLI